MEYELESLLPVFVMLINCMNVLAESPSSPLTPFMPTANLVQLVNTAAGDQTAHLWWRLLHGAVFERHQPKLSIVLIGGNDLEAAASCGDGSAVIAAAVPQMVSRYAPCNSHVTGMVVTSALAWAALIH